MVMVQMMLLEVDMVAKLVVEVMEMEIPVVLEVMSVKDEVVSIVERVLVVEAWVIFVVGELVLVVKGVAGGGRDDGGVGGLGDGVSGELC
jgi:hypothetical protein